LLKISNIHKHTIFEADSIDLKKSRTSNIMVSRGKSYAIIPNNSCGNYGLMGITESNYDHKTMAEV